MKREGLHFWLLPHEKALLANTEINDLHVEEIVASQYPGTGKEATLYRFPDEVKANAFENDLAMLNIQADFQFIDLVE